MRYLLDTNILSDIAKPSPSKSLLAWMSEQVDEDLFIASAHCRRNSPGHS